MTGEPDHPEHPSGDEPDDAAGALLDRYLDAGDPADLAAARRAYADAVAADPDDLYLLNDYGNCLRVCHEAGGPGTDLDEAARVLDRSARLVEPDDPTRATIADNRALVRGDRFAATGDPAELDAAVVLHRFAVAVDGDDNHLLHMTNLASALMTRYDERGQLRDLDEAVRRYRTAVHATPAGSVDVPLRLANLARALLERHDRRGHRRDLDDAVGAAEQALRHGSPSAVDRSRQEATLADALRRRHELDGNPDDLDRAVTGYRWAAEHTPPGARSAAGWWGNLAVALQRRHELAGRPGDLDAAVDAAERALDLAAPGSTGQARVRTQLGQVLVERHRRDGDPATLDRAIGELAQALAQTPPQHPARAGRASNLGIALMDRWHLVSDPADLDRAGALFTEAAAGAVDAVDAALHLNNVGMVALGRHRRTGDPAELDAAVAQLERAVTTDPTTARYRINLGDALALRHDRGGDAADLRGAVDAHRTALDALGPSAPLRVEALRGLANDLLAAFERAGVVRDLHEAVDLLRAAVTATPPGSPDLPGNLNDLGNALRVAYRHTGSVDALAEARTAFEQALDVAVDTAPDRAVYLDNLASALSEQPLAGADLDTVDRALAAQETAVRLLPEGSPEHGRVAANLGGTWWERWRRSGDHEDLRRAVALTRRALADTPEGSPVRALRRNTLAVALRDYDRLTGDLADRDEAHAAFRAACHDGAATDATWAVHAARNWGRWAAELDDQAVAAEAFGYGLAALRRVFARQHDRPDKESWLRQAVELPAEAARAHALAGSPATAVAALDAGRALLLAETLAGRLPAAADPGHTLALTEPARSPSKRRRAQQGADVTEPEGIEAVRAARAELDAVIEEIRGVEGFEQFLAPPTFDDVAGTATEVPLVYLAAAEQGGLALVVRGDRPGDDQVVHVPLDTLTAEALREKAQAHLDAYAAARDDTARWSRWLSEVTGWLWTAAVGPVLDELGAAPEAVFVAGGLLGLLPLHAAWTPDPSTPTGRRYALDQLTISYAPNARALQAARELAGREHGRRLLSVVEPTPVAAPSLPAAAVEAAGFAAYAGHAQTSMAGAEARPAAFRREAPRADVLHLACHGRADLDEPLNSHLLLVGRPVVLRELMEMPLAVRLAVLSACETALPGTELPDEVIGLPTGLLQAGVAGVVASLWAVPDRATAMLMTEFARRWAGGAASPAAALRGAQRWLRDSTNAEKRDHWQADPNLPPAVAAAFGEAVVFGEDDHRDHADLPAWAAFTHLGA
ncbi:MAG: CHAT domain-containing protein [Pseudonocardia sp.]